MKLYNSIGPNPHVVRAFLAEKGVAVPLVAVDLLAGENRVQSAQMLDSLVALGAPEAEALLVTRLFDLDNAIGGVLRAFGLKVKRVRSADFAAHARAAPVFWQRQRCDRGVGACRERAAVVVGRPCADIADWPGRAEDRGRAPVGRGGQREAAAR